MAPRINIPNKEDFERAKKILELSKVNYSIPKNNKINQIAELDRKDWIVVPKKEGNEFVKDSYAFDISPARLSYNSAVKKVGKKLNIDYKNTGEDSLGRGFVGNNDWNQSLMLNQFLGVKTPNMKEEIDYLHLLYLGSQDKIKVWDVSGKQVDSKLCEKLLIDTIKPKSPWRGEFIDANYKTNGNDLEVHSEHVFNNNGNIKDYQSEILDKDTLMQDKKIDVIDFIIKNNTSQGHVSKKVKSGNFNFWYPRRDNNSVAGFFAVSYWASLNCFGIPSYRNSVLGVRAAKLRE